MRGRLESPRMAPRRPGPGELLAGASGLLLLGAMFLPWFGLNGRARVPNLGVIDIGARNLNAWEAFGAIDIVLALTAAVALAYGAVAFVRTPPALLALALIAGAAVSALLIVYRLIDPPNIHVEASDTAYETARRLGAFFGLLCTAGMTWGANFTGAAAEAPARKWPAAAEPGPAEPAEPEPAPASPSPAPEPVPAAAPAPAPRAPAPPAPAAWGRPEIDAACQQAWRRYDRRLGARYERYFEDNPDLAGEQRISARDYAAALPPDWPELVEAIPDDARHRQHLSGKSSQTLAVGLLGVAARQDPSLGWLWDALSPLPPPASDAPRIEFEHRVAPDLLGERPRQTTIDVLVDDPEVVIAIESKWREHGIATCLCRGDGVGPAAGLRCSRRVEQRDPYWDAAATIGLGEREEGAPCPISPAYQAVRNCAAVRALAGPERLAVFALLYDEHNPYFAPSDDWPGWPGLLDEAISTHADSDDLRFAAISWQQLVPTLPLDDSTRAWAGDKHGLD
jgi:Restriction Endonuclease associating with ARP